MVCALIPSRSRCLLREMMERFPSKNWGGALICFLLCTLFWEWLSHLTHVFQKVSDHQLENLEQLRNETHNCGGTGACSSKTTDFKNYHMCFGVSSLHLHIIREKVNPNRVATVFHQQSINILPKPPKADEIS